MDAASYYADLTAQYGRYAGATQGWHYGVWEDGVHNHDEALLRSNEILLRDLAVGPATSLLDLGFGSGGFAVWAAGRYGCRVTGITVVPRHVVLARQLAEAHGVAGRCRFLVMDMDRLACRGERFDVVVSQDTFCHAADKPACLAEVFRVLRPGGAWRAIDFSIQSEPLYAAQQESYEVVRQGFHIPSLAAEAEVRELLERVGFSDIQTRDVTPHVLPTASLILRRCWLPLLMIRLRLDWTVFFTSARRRRNRQGHILAAKAYSAGLRQGFFRHCFYSALRPIGSDRG